MGYIGASADSAIGFSDGGLLTGLGADTGKKVSNDFANRITSDTNTSPDRIRYFGDPISAFGLIIRLCSHHLDSGGKIARIVIRGYLLRMLYLFMIQ